MSRQVKIIVGAVIAVLLLSTVGAVFFLGGGDSPSKSVSGDIVRIEVRGNPTMSITKDGKKIGTTPMQFVAKRSTAPIFLEARWSDTYFAPTGASRVVHKRKTQSIIPDHDMTVDFTRTPFNPNRGSDDGSDGSATE